MNLKKFLEKILESDSNIRFAPVFDRFGMIRRKVLREGIPQMMDEYDTQNML